MLITNLTTRDLGIAEGYVIPAMGALDVPQDVLDATQGSAVVEHWFGSGALVLDTPNDAAEAEPQPQSETDDQRMTIIQGIIRGLGDGDFTKGGKPEVDAINDVLPETHERVTAAERDAAWVVIEAERA